MADRLITPEVAKAHMLAQCPGKVDVSMISQQPGSEHVCGCGRCPAPDPTPEEYRRRIEHAAWQRVMSDG